MDAERRVMDRVVAEAVDFLGGLDERPVCAAHDVDQVAEALGGPLPETGEDPVAVLDALVAGAGPGVVATPSGRFFGWVIGGVLPAALGADWLTSLWDQNAGLLASSPAAAGAERVAAGWLLDLLGLPADAGVGFVTGAMMANFTCLAAARHAVYRRIGWDVEADGLTGAPSLTVVVGEERHDTVDVALRYLGLGPARSVVVPADGQGRLRLDALAAALEARAPGPLVVCLQAGNVNSGAFDPLGPAVDLVHAHGGWAHVDGAFGLWAAAAPGLRHLTAGHERADSWATDAHKTLNVPYDSGLAVVADAAALHAAMGVHAAYLIQDERPDPIASVPEFSRRARGFTVWAALRSLGRTGVAELVQGFVDRAHRFAAALDALDGVAVVNDVDFTQVCLAFDGDVETRESHAGCWPRGRPG
ncbi:pyridoxal phosphate-dependent decarboxylase family protein [Microlunatus capsulatus]|uniref:Glutamate/tyrosine decarboxylase-like PLP-dependent enzyme n=1 Tax=Microlunatus capsulatus TaxID=99117 RepID=A0ABS4ZDK8_9ACTN|nr:pyridoxal-dependent decarboxylase [Microlunatus capsulatus]MBP2418812.1 glutamate/tyrosine decarboxylase-like PLP-dependent enzyme [Microlunatus capsulatus]